MVERKRIPKSKILTEFDVRQAETEPGKPKWFLLTDSVGNPASLLFAIGQLGKHKIGWVVAQTGNRFRLWRERKGLKLKNGKLYVTG
ncbi:MAG: hypothetical protein KAW17_09600 [Candidatus Eisenbacteria sp.]|nr:hypothetical protein [Candidatus Eisenbacteria bacterium]